jgi:hypothetical protein
MGERNILNDNPRLQIGWPFDPNADYTATWERIEQRAGRKFSHKDRREMHEAGIIFKRCTGRPPDRIQFVFTHWSLYLDWLMREKRKKLISA